MVEAPAEYDGSIHEYLREVEEEFEHVREQLTGEETDFTESSHINGRYHPEQWMALRISSNVARISQEDYPLTELQKLLAGESSEELANDLNADTDGGPYLVGIQKYTSGEDSIQIRHMIDEEGTRVEIAECEDKIVEKLIEQSLGGDILA